AVTTLVRIRDLGLPRPAGGVMLSPWTDLAMTGASVAENADSDSMLTPMSMDWAARHYLQSADPRDPLASPLYADLAGLPPLLVTASTTEILRDDAMRLVDRANAAGVDARLELYRDMLHVFQVFVSMPEARRSLRHIAEFVSELMMP